MRKLQLTLEKHLLKQIVTTKLYGKQIEAHLDKCLHMIYLSMRFRLLALRKQCVSYVIGHFEKRHIVQNPIYLELFSEEIRLDLLDKLIDHLQEKLKSKEAKCKQMEDDLLRQKFEIQRLLNNNSNNNNLNK